MKPSRLIKALALSFALGALLSIGSSPDILHQAEAMAVAKGRASAASAVQWVGRVLGHWLEWGVDAGLKGAAKQFTQPR